MSTATINSTESLQSAFGKLREDFQQHKYLRLSWKTGKARSLPQNNFTHAWYEQIARELREDDELGWKCYCKLHHGVPILRAEDGEFREIYDTAIKGLSYEMKLKIMRYLPVTSLMNRSQLSKYAKEVQDDFFSRGVILNFPGGE